jgi:hypothetical protein
MSNITVEVGVTSRYGWSQGCGSGFKDFVDPDSESGPDPWKRKMKKKMHFSLTFKTFL